MWYALFLRPLYWDLVPTHRSFTLKRTSKLLSRIKPTSPMKKMNPIKQRPPTIPTSRTRVKIPTLSNPVTNLTSLRVVTILGLKIKIDKLSSRSLFSPF
jgi:hypothetical protein